MIARIGALCLVIFWAVMMGWLAWHDVWPAWTAQNPPVVAFDDLPTPGSVHFQAGIFDRRGRRIGSIWTTHIRLSDAILREDCIWIERFSALPPTRIEVNSTFDADGRFDEIEACVYGHGVAIELNGERFPREFAFELRVGHLRPRRFKIPHTHAGMFGDLFKPFATLPDLRVGQSWRMQVFNPLAAVAGFGDTFTPMLVRVTGTDTVVRNGAVVECFVVEASGSRALVGHDGVVYEQSVELPVGGTIVVRDEPYDDEARKRARSVELPGNVVEVTHGF